MVAISDTVIRVDPYSFDPQQRNGTLTEVSTINTGHNGMDKFGYLDQLNGMSQLPFWDSEPCTNITASEGSFFPPREYTKTDMRYVYDKDLCRIIPLQYKHTVYKDGTSTANECAARSATNRTVVADKHFCFSIQLQASRPIITAFRRMCTATLVRMRIIRASIPTTSKHPKACRTSAHANTVRIASTPPKF